MEDRQKEDARELLEEMKLLEESLDLKINTQRSKQCANIVMANVYVGNA